MRSLLHLGLVILVGCSDSSGSSNGGGGTGSAAGGAGAGTADGGNGAGFAGGAGGGDAGAPPVVCAEPCQAGESCSHGTCIPTAPCDQDGDCEYDTYCDEAEGICIPWDTAKPGYDPTCIQVSVPGLLSPKVRCEFSAAPEGDPFLNHLDVQSTPVVARFGEEVPNIVATFTATVAANYTEDAGVIRVLRGDDCSLVQNLGGTDLDADGVVDFIVSSSTLAVGDLDLDGVAEIVAYGTAGDLLAFKKTAGVWGLHWKAPRPAGAPWAVCNATLRRCPLGWAGASIHDLDDDGSPEIIREGVVFDASGAVLSGGPAGYASYHAGLFPVIANLDQDPAVEFTNGAFLWEWIDGAWVADPAYAPGIAAGFTAVADFGAFGSGPPEDAEIVIVANDTVQVRALDGSIVLAPTSSPGNGGGPPTVSDFDGDGLVEVGVAGRAFYTVYDPDCADAARPGGTCELGPCNGLNGPCVAGGGLLWSHSTQDLSSQVTGSSIFDFEADGRSEVVYGDECFTRVYDGQTGDVLFSQYRSSCTWYENPIIADADGNFRADLVTPSNKACSPDGNGIPCQNLTPEGVDPQWPGVRCQVDADCESDVCSEGLCRCTTSADCCGLSDDECVEQGLKCAPPPAGTPGEGMTCRASHPHGVSGIRVYSDVNDLWVRSRTIWNQHAYAVTNVNEDGTIPMTSDWQTNWLDPTLNNFRQNVPGDAMGSEFGDGTAGAAQFEGCDGGVALLEVEVCNRGTAPLGAGIPVEMRVGAEVVCSTETGGALSPGDCLTVGCSWSDPPVAENEAVDVEVVFDPAGEVAECENGNNRGGIFGVFCEPVK